MRVVYKANKVIVYILDQIWVLLLAATATAAAAAGGREKVSCKRKRKILVYIGRQTNGVMECESAT